MQYTPHYNLNLPEGTDIVNPLVQDNPNYTVIDATMYANKLRVIGTATELASGTVHALTRSDTDINAFKFVATADFNTGDTFTVDGVSVTARRPDGATMKNKAYVINSTVLCILDGTILNFIGVDGVVDGSNVSYDNTISGLSASTDQDAIDEICDRMNYSTTEHVIGKWIDNKPLYEKVISFGALPNNTSKSVPHGLNLTYVNIISIQGSAFNPSAGAIPLPLIVSSTDVSDLAVNVALSMDLTNVIIKCMTNRSAYTGTIILRYTKNN